MLPESETYCSPARPKFLKKLFKKERKEGRKEGRKKEIALQLVVYMALHFTQDSEPVFEIMEVNKKCLFISAEPLARERERERESKRK